jgi:hypothetical protein
VAWCRQAHAARLCQTRQQGTHQQALTSLPLQPPQARRCPPGALTAPRRRRTVCLLLVPRRALWPKTPSSGSAAHRAQSQLEMSLLPAADESLALLSL